MYKYGLVSVSFRNLEPEQIIFITKEAGLSYIEWGSDVHAPCDDINRIRKLRYMCDRAGISCCSYGTYFRVGKDNAETLLPYIKAAKELGTNVIRIWCGTKGSEEYSAEEKVHLFDECIKCAGIAEKNDVILCCECHNNTQTDTLTGALELMKAVNSVHFRMYWQPNQYKTFDVNSEYAQSVAEYVKVIHVFNWDGDRKYPLCEAIDVWKSYLNKLPCDIPLLLEFMPDGKAESLKKEAEALFMIGGR